MSANVRKRPQMSTFSRQGLRFPRNKANTGVAEITAPGRIMENPHRKVRICTQKYAFLTQAQQNAAVLVLPIHHVKEHAIPPKKAAEKGPAGPKQHKEQIYGTQAQITAANGFFIWPRFSCYKLCKFI